MDRINKIDSIIFFCLGGLILILPIAHTTTIRAFLLLFALFLWLVKMYINKDWKIARTPLDIPLLLFLITIILSFFSSLKLSTSIDELRGEFLTYTILFYMVASNIKKEEDVLYLAKVLIIGSLFIAIYGIVDSFKYSNNLFSSIDYRTGSLHQGYEAYAQYIIMVLPFNMLGLFYIKEVKGRFFLSVVFLLNCLALYLTYTRGAWLALWVEIILISFLAFKKAYIKTLLMIGLISVSIFAISSLPKEVIWHYGDSGFSLDEDSPLNSADQRITMWYESSKYLMNHPFQGAGYGKANFERRFADKSFAGYEQAHNTFVNTAIQLGMQGLIALLIIIFVILKISWIGWKYAKSDFQRNFFLAMFVMTIGFFVANQFAEFYIDDTAQMYWLFVGLCISIYNSNIVPVDKKQ